MVKIIKVDRDENYNGCTGFWNVHLSEKLTGVEDYMVDDVRNKREIYNIEYFSRWHNGKGPHIYIDGNREHYDELMALVDAVKFLKEHGVEIDEKE